MRSLGYLNTVLTLIALLLTLHLWTLWTASPAIPAPADAGAQQIRSTGGSVTPTGPNSGGLPDAASQRREMVDQLRLANQKLEKIDQLIELFRDGKARVRVEAVPGDKTAN